MSLFFLGNHRATTREILMIPMSFIYFVKIHKSPHTDFMKEVRMYEECLQVARQCSSPWFSLPSDPQCTSKQKIIFK